MKKFVKHAESGLYPNYVSSSSVEETIYKPADSCDSDQDAIYVLQPPKILASENRTPIFDAQNKVE